jgi:hypothetical protein
MYSWNQENALHMAAFRLFRVNYGELEGPEGDAGSYYFKKKVSSFLYQESIK